MTNIISHCNRIFLNITKSISAKIFIIFTCVLLLFFCFITILFNNFISESLLEQARMSDLKLINTISNAINSEIDKVRISGTVLQTDKTIIDYIKNITQESQKLDSKLIYLAEDSSIYTRKYQSILSSKYISLIDKDGYLIGEQRLDREKVYNFLGKTYVSNLSTETPTLGAMYHILDLENNTIHNIFPYIFPLKDENAILIGYAILYLDELDIRKTFEQYGSSISILNHDDVILSSVNDSTIYYNYHKYYKINYSWLLKNTTTITTLNEHKVIITTATINSLGWNAIIAKDFQDLLEESNYNSAYVSTVFLFIFVITGFITYLISKYISHPIVILNNCMKKVQMGALQERVHNHSQDEIGELSESFNEMLDAIENLLRNNNEEQLAKRKTQMQLIQAQIKPHFLYNILGIISGFMNEGEKHLGNLAINSLANFYRISLSDGSDLITLAKEIELLENYLTLQRLRYVDLIDYEIDIDDELIEILIPKLTLQPLIENAIYHGIRNKPNGGFIQVRGYKDNFSYFIIIKDNGLGMEKEKLQELNEAINHYTITTHFGLSSVNKRLELSYGHKANMTIQSEKDKYTSITLKIPVNYL